jgi:hypothetical protein
LLLRIRRGPMDGDVLEMSSKERERAHAIRQVSWAALADSTHRAAGNLTPTVHDTDDLYIIPAGAIERDVRRESPRSHTASKRWARPAHAWEVDEAFERPAQATDKRTSNLFPSVSGNVLCDLAHIARSCRSETQLRHISPLFAQQSFQAGKYLFRRDGHAAVQLG